MVSTEPGLSAFLADHWPDARRLWFAAVPAALGLFGIVWGGSWRVPGYVIVAAAIFYVGAVAWQRRRFRRANRADFADGSGMETDFQIGADGHTGARTGRGEQAAAGTSAGTHVDAGVGTIGDGLRGPTEGPSSLTVLPALRVCAVDRAFRPQTLAAIDGWLRYNLGSSSDRATSAQESHPAGMATAIGAPSGDSFVAVFEPAMDAGATSPIHVVAPGNWWCMGCITAVARDLAAPFVPGTHTYRAFVTAATAQARSFPFAAAQVSARLTSILDGPDDDRRRVDVAGASLGPGTILAGAFRFAGEEEWHQVFPFEILRKMAEIAGRYSPVFRVSSIYGSTRPRLEILRRS